MEGTALRRGSLLGGRRAIALAALVSLAFVAACACIALERAANADTELSENIVTVQDGNEVVDGEVLVTVDARRDASDVREALEEQRIDVDRVSVVSDSLEEGKTLYRVEYSGKLSPDDVAEQLEDNAIVENAELNYVFELSDSEDEPQPSIAVPNDEYLSSQWGLSSINATKAWERVQANHTVTVAVLDTGVDTDHPDLQGNLLLDYAFNAVTKTNSASAVEDQTGHGTHVCGIIAAQANNSIGVAGVSYNAYVIPVNVRSAEGKISADSIVSAIDYIVDLKKGSNDARLNGIKIANMSFGIRAEPDSLPSVCKALDRLEESGITVVASAGNCGKSGGESTVEFPANYDGVIAVSALKDSPDTMKFDDSYSSYGSEVDISAPGSSIYSTIIAGSYGYKTGTSMATPFVSGALALAFAADPDATSDVAVQAMYESALDLGTEGKDDLYGHGALQLDALVDKMLEHGDDPGGGDDPQTDVQITRVAGEDRYDTAARTALLAYPDGSKGAIVASGENFPDALSASILAGVKDYPILLTSKNRLSDDTVNALAILDPSEIIIVGGTAAISSSVESSLLEYAPKVKRISGGDRYGTSVAVFDALSSEYGDVCIIATGENYADALSVSPYASENGYPIFLCDPTSGLSSETEDAIENGGFSLAIVVGGTSAVPTGVVTWLKYDAMIPSVIRLSGDDRYQTSQEIASYSLLHGFGIETVGIATGRNFPDALAAGPYLGSRKATLLLADAVSNESLSVISASSGKVESIFIFGGVSVVPTSVEEYAKNLASSEE